MKRCIHESALNRTDKSDEFGPRLTAPGHFTTVATASSTPEICRSIEIVRASRYAWLDWIRIGWGRVVVEQVPHTRIGVQKPAHMSSRTFSNSCDQVLDSHRPEIRRLEDRPSRRTSGLGKRCHHPTPAYSGSFQPSLAKSYGKRELWLE